MVQNNWFITKGQRIDQFLISLPVPNRITNWWSNGSLLGVVYVNQIVTGLLMASFYSGGLENSFERVIYIETEVWSGWLWRSLHFNGANMFFIFVYLHIGRGLYFGRFVKKGAWLRGRVLVLLLIGIAFIGYVLPWGQISYWGATVITNLLSVVPVVGESLVRWLWGGFRVGGVTITRFYIIHFLLPLVLGAIIGSHLILLHEKGSRNPVGVIKSDKIPFLPYFVWKDWVWFRLMLGGIGVWRMELTWELGEVDNWEIANGLVTPDHIKPEWYFLFAYGVLRRVPRKGGGVIALLGRVFIIPISRLVRRGRVRRRWSRFKKRLFWVWVCVWALLRWAGGKPVEDPYRRVGWWCGLLYFVGWVGVVI